MKKPALRFKRFDGEWGDCELGKIITSFSGGTPTAGCAEYYNGSIPFIRSGEINCSETELFITPKGLDNSSAKLVEKGDILYALYGATSGEVGRSKINGAINQAILAIRPVKGFDSNFMAFWLRKSKKSIIDTYLQGGQGNLSGEIVKKLVYSYPLNNAEQKAIGSFFSELDALIEGKRVKLDKLKKLKLAYLGKMFPKKGSRVPEVRFKGFSGDWDERKLSDYLTICPLVNSDNQYKAKDVLSVSGEFGVVNQIEFQGRSFAGASLLKYRVSETGTVIYTKSPLKANPYGIIKANKGPTGIVSVLYAVYVPNDNADADFVQVYFDDLYRLNSYLRTLVNKGAKNTLLISDEEALNGYVVFPSRPEQRKIAAFFNHLDNLINLQQQELDKLSNIKSACLSKMFA